MIIRPIVEDTGLLYHIVYNIITAKLGMKNCLQDGWMNVNRYT